MKDKENHDELKKEITNYEKNNPSNLKNWNRQLAGPTGLQSNPGQKMIFLAKVNITKYENQ